MKSVASIVLDLKLDSPLDYEVPLDFRHKIKIGSRVEVPLRGKPQKGYVVDLKNNSSFANLKPIFGVIKDELSIPEDLFELGLWMSKYYLSPLRQVLKVLVPASVRKETKEKEQLFVMREKTKEELIELAKQIRLKSPSQALILDEMLLIKKGILLTELLEKTKCSRSSVDALVQKKALAIDIVRIDRSPLVNADYIMTKPKTLTGEQKEALESIQKSLLNGTFETHLLFGITGSGKTEVYLQAIDKALQLGKSVIMLVPEIALTSQTIERMRSRFEGKIAVLHHRLSHGERMDEWQRMRRKEAQIAIGARSAVFSPLPDVGLIIVDEEHEGSYKQTEESPCYNARDLSVMRGKMANATVVLGSATPSLESYQNAMLGKYRCLKLSSRPDSASLPKVTIIDMKEEMQKAGGFTHFSSKLIDAIKLRLEKGEKTILFLNRRGYHTSLFCNGCKEPFKCRHCDVSLTYHQKDERLSCHLCGFTLAPSPKHCPSCNTSDTMKFKGAGTEQIEKALHALFPNVRTLRLDADTTRHKGSHQKLLKEFATGKADILVGTQMIAKGLHFPDVTLVSALNCDAGLQIPDFRASETTFQLITQVAGRAGRGPFAGEVIIQTQMPDFPAITLAAKQDYEAFFAHELDSRKLFHYPPFANLVKVFFSGENLQETTSFGEFFRKKLIEVLPKDYEVLCLAAAGHAKVKDKFRMQFIVKGKSSQTMTRALEEVLSKVRTPKSIKQLIDVNPLSTFF